MFPFWCSSSRTNETPTGEWTNRDKRGQTQLMHKGFYGILRRMQCMQLCFQSAIVNERPLDPLLQAQALILGLQECETLETDCCSPWDQWRWWTVKESRTHWPRWSPKRATRGDWIEDFCLAWLRELVAQKLPDSMKNSILWGQHRASQLGTAGTAMWIIF